MAIQTVQMVFAAGAAGGVALELLHWYALRRDPKLPAYAGSPIYWIITAGMIALGGLVAVLYFGARAEALLAFHVGASTPLILQKLTTTIAKQPGAKGGSPTVLDFFHW
jgi:hypothetical protein